MLDAVGVDPEADDAAAALELDPVQHHNGQAQIIQRPAHQLDQVLARARDELAADRRLARGPQEVVDVAADRLTGAGIAARGDAGQHPLEHHVGEPVARGEVRVRAQLDPPPPIDAARPRPAESDAPPAERDLTSVVAVPNRGTIRVMLALGADDLVDFRLHQLVQHAEPNADAERQQALLCGAGELAQRVQHRRRHALDALRVGRDRHGRYGPHGGWSSCPRTWFAPVTLPTGADEAGGPPPSSSTSYGTTSSRRRRKGCRSNAV